VSRRQRILIVDTVPRTRASKTPPPASPAKADDQPEATDERRRVSTASWGRPTPADALALRGLPAIGYGIGSGAIKGTQPGRNLR
jgi:hypothetical protein